MRVNTGSMTADEAVAAAAARRRALRQRTSIYGAVLLAALLLLVGLIIRTFTTGGSYITVTALVSRAGDALQDGDEVRFRDLIVGKVVGTGELQGDVTRLELHVDPELAAQIPAGVTSRPVPTTLFGSQYVQLVPPEHPGNGGLVAGTVVPADTSPGTTALQTALAEVDSLLAAIHPAQLDVALTNLATALSGQGARLGSLLDNLDAYIRDLSPSVPALQSDISQLAALAEQLSADAPDNLRSIGNLSVTAQTLTARQVQLRGLLSGGITLADDLTPFLTQNGDRIITVVRDLQPVLAALAANPGGLANGVINLDTLARDWTTFLGPGHYARINFLLKNLDVGSAAVASLGGPTGRPAADRAFAALLNPPTYSSADCPRYPGASGPNCAAAQPAVSRPAATGGLVGPVGSADEQQAVRELVGHYLGIPPERVPPITDLIVGPVLRGAAVVML
jgi:virulence factor Mce-like protein